MYKTGMAVPQAMIATALFHCCDDELRNDLMRDIQDDVSSMSEDELLAAIKRLAVKEESTLVHRMKLSKMMQAPGSINANDLPFFNLFVYNEVRI